jgi:hypothetical protein
MEQSLRILSIRQFTDFELQYYTTNEMGDRKGAYRILVGRPEGKRPLGRHGCRREDNIKMDFEVGWGMDWIDLAQDRDSLQALVNAVMNLRFPQNAGNFLTS